MTTHDAISIAESIAASMAKVGCPLEHDQELMLKASLSVWIDRLRLQFIAEQRAERVEVATDKAAADHGPYDGQCVACGVAFKRSASSIACPRCTAISRKSARAY